MGAKGAIAAITVRASFNMLVQFRGACVNGLQPSVRRGLSRPSVQPKGCPRLTVLQTCQHHRKHLHHDVATAPNDLEISKALLCTGLGCAGVAALVCPNCVLASPHSVLQQLNTHTHTHTEG
eukprot:15460969-Alexandrium_andersonii.AAC.1